MGSYWTGLVRGVLCTVTTYVEEHDLSSRLYIRERHTERHMSTSRSDVQSVYIPFEAMYSHWMCPMWAGRRVGGSLAARSTGLTHRVSGPARWRWYNLARNATQQLHHRRKMTWCAVLVPTRPDQLAQMSVTVRDSQQFGYPTIALRIWVGQRLGTRLLTTET
jgi:hypothetical protein